MNKNERLIYLQTLQENADAWTAREPERAEASVAASNDPNTVTLYVGARLGKKIVYDGYGHYYDAKAKPGLSSLGIEQHHCPDADTLHALMRTLVNSDKEQRRALTLGHVTETVARYLLGNGTIKRLKHGNRLHGTMRDTLTHCFAIDIDGMPNDSGFDILGEWPNVARWIVTDRMPEEFADAAIGIYPTAKCGMVNNLISARIVARMRNPVMLEQMQSYVTTRVRATCGDYVDPAIYNAQAYIFTAPPIIERDGKRAPDPFGARYTVIGEGDLDPGELEYATPRVRDTEIDAVIRSGSREAMRSYVGAKISEIVKDLRPGNVQRGIMSITGKVAIASPRHRKAETKDMLRQILTEALDAVPGDEEKRAERKREHIDTVDERVERMDVLKYGYAQPVARPPIPRIPLEQAREQVGALAQRALLLGMAWQRPEDAMFVAAPHTVINATLGIGKTEAVIRALRAIDTTIKRVHILVPTDELGEELLHRLRAGLRPEQTSDIYLRQHRGRARPGMCKDAEAGNGRDAHNQKARKFEALGFSPYDEVCAHCPHHNTCKWVEQRGDGGTGIIIRTHAHINSTYALLQPESEAAPDVCIIDEAPLNALLRDLEAIPVEAVRARGAFATFKRYQRARSFRDDEEGHDTTIYTRTADFQAHRKRWHDLLRDCGEVIDMSKLEWLWNDVDVERRDGTRARVPEWKLALQIEQDLRRFIDMRLKDATHRDHLAKFATLRDTNRQQRAVSLIISRIVDLALISRHIEGRERIFGVRMESRAGDLHVVASEFHALPRVLREKPVILLDATADRTVCTAMFGCGPEAIDFHQIDAEPGKYELALVGDETYGKAALIGGNADDGEDSEERKKRADSRLCYLHRVAHSIALEEHNRGEEHDLLVLCAKGVAEPLRQVGELQRVAFLTYGRSRGIDAYRHVPAVIAVGRSTPDVPTLERNAEALHARNHAVRDISRHPTWIRGRREIEGVGCWYSIESEMHPDPVVEAYRQQIVDAEVIQGVGRARVVNRTDESKVRIWLFGQTDVRLPITDILARSDMQRTPLDIMMERGFIVASHADMQRIYPAILAREGRGREAMRTIWQEALERYAEGKLTPPSGRTCSWHRTELLTARGARIEALIDVARVSAAGARRLLRERFASTGDAVVTGADDTPAFAEF